MSTRSLVQDFSGQAFAAGLLASFVGFGSTFAVILQGLIGVGADERQAASGLMALAVAMGLAGIVLSLRTRMPVSVAWSTPGAALLATSHPPQGGFSGAVGAFMVAAALIILAGLWRPLGRLVAAIPGPLASAMLAGILLGLCLAPVRAIASEPALALAVVLSWALVGCVRRVLAVPAAVLAAVALVLATAAPQAGTMPALTPHPVLVLPSLTLDGVLGIALPLFVVTMASQNIPGIAILAVNGFRPSPGPLFAMTGLFSLAAAPFGALSINLAAITATLCASADAHPDPSRRYWAAMVSGAGYIAFGLAAGAVMSFVRIAPPLLVEAVAGLALLGPLGNALSGAVSSPGHREAAVITFVVAASGTSFFGVGGAFWGLLAGAAMLGLRRWTMTKP